MSNNPTNWPPQNDGSFQQPTTNAPPPPDDQGWNGNNSWSKMQAQQQQMKDHSMNDINKMMSNVQIGQQNEGGWAKQQDVKDPQFNWNNKTPQELASTTPSWGPNPQQGWGPQPPQQVAGGADNGTNAWGSAEQQGQKWNHSNTQQSPQTSTPQNPSENPAVPTSNSDSQNKLTAVVAPNNQNITENPNTSAAPTQTTNSDDLKPAPQQQKEAAADSKPDIQQKSEAKEKIDPVVRLVNMHDGWGNTPVNQQTKWDTSQSCIIRPGSQNSAAYPPNPNGTDGWGRNSGQMQNSGWNDSRRTSNNSNWHGNNHGNSWNSSSNHGPGGYGNNQQWGNDHRGGDNWNSGSNQWNSNNQGMNNRWEGPPAGMHGGARSGYNSMNNRNYGGGNMGSQWNNPNMDNYGRNDMRSRPIDNGTSQWGQPPEYNDNQKWGQMNRGMGFGGHGNMNHSKWDSQMGGNNQHKQGNDWNDKNNWNKNRQQDLWNGSNPWNNKSIQQPNNWNGQNNYQDNSTWSSHNQQKYGGPGNRNMPEYAGMMGNNASMNRHQSIGNQMHVHPGQLYEQAVKAGMPQALFQGTWQNNEPFVRTLKSWVSFAQDLQNNKSRMVQGPLDQMIIRQLTVRNNEIDESMANLKDQLMQIAGISPPANFMPKNQGMQPPVRTQSNFSAMSNQGGWGGNPPQMKDEMNTLKQFQGPDSNKPNKGAVNTELKDDQAGNPLNPASPIVGLDGVPEFTPGKMWSGLATQIDPDNDPNITPALMKQMDSKGAQQQEQAKPTASSTEQGWSNQSANSTGCCMIISNFMQGIEVEEVRNLCQTFGQLVNFTAHYPINTAIARYSNPMEAQNAKKNMNFHRFGQFMILTSIASDSEVENYNQAASQSANSWQNPAGGNGFNQQQWSSGGQQSQGGQQAGQQGGQPWQQGQPQSAQQEDTPLHSLLPNDLLQNEMM